MAGQLTIDTLRASTGVLATQNGMTGIAKAWVNFAGASGTVNGSFNVSSVTRISTGYYSVNFTTAMANANYAGVSGITSDNSPSTDNPRVAEMINTSTSVLTLKTMDSTSGTLGDYSAVYVIVCGA